jgi:hypothetical protein
MPRLLLLLLAGCTIQKMAVAPDLRAQEPYQRPFTSDEVRFGAFRIAAVSRSAGAIPARTHRLFTSDTVQSSYQFDLVEGAFARHVACEMATQVSQLALGKGNLSSTSSEMECDLGDGARLQLAGGKGLILSRGPAAEVTGRAFDGREDSGSMLWGYSLRAGGRELAAVQVVNGGWVWLGPDLDPGLRSVLAAASGALLLYQEVK